MVGFMYFIMMILGKEVKNFFVNFVSFFYIVRKEYFINGGDCGCLKGRNKYGRLDVEG